MKNILVTGATGFIGSNLIIELLNRGYEVRAFHRINSNLITLSGVNVEHFTGDILNKNSLRDAMHGCDTVFHTAAKVSFWKGDRNEQYQVNVHGTRNVVETCIECGIEKLIHTSTIAALGYRSDAQPINEETTYNWGNRYAYRYTKHLAEIEVLNGVKKGLNATIVNPSVILGPRDVYSHGGILIKSIKRGRIPVYTDGGINIVSVHDVVAGEIAAAERGRASERYILGGVNLAHKEMFELIAKIIDGKAPTIKVPHSLILFAGNFSDIVGTLLNSKPFYTSDLAVTTIRYNWYSTEKAKHELGYQPSSIENAIREAYEWYVEHRMI